MLADASSSRVLAARSQILQAVVQQMFPDVIQVGTHQSCYSYIFQDRGVAHVVLQFGHIALSTQEFDFRSYHANIFFDVSAHVSVELIALVQQFMQALPRIDIIGYLLGHVCLDVSA